MSNKIIEFKKERTMVDAMGDVLELYKDGSANKESAATALKFLSSLAYDIRPQKRELTHEQVKKQMESRARL